MVSFQSHPKVHYRLCVLAAMGGTAHAEFSMAEHVSGYECAGAVRGVLAFVSVGKGTIAHSFAAPSAPKPGHETLPDLEGVVTLMEVDLWRKSLAL
jgi:hypothetical protein